MRSFKLPLDFNNQQWSQPSTSLEINEHALYLIRELKGSEKGISITWMDVNTQSRKTWNRDASQKLIP